MTDRYKMSPEQVKMALELSMELLTTLATRGAKENIHPSVMVASLVTTAMSMRVMMVEPACSSSEAVDEIIDRLQSMRSLATPLEKRSMS